MFVNNNVKKRKLQFTFLLIQCLESDGVIDVTAGISSHVRLKKSKTRRWETHRMNFGVKVKRWRGFRCLNRLVKLQKIIENPACLIFLARLPEKYDTPKEAVDYELFQHILHYSAADWYLYGFIPGVMHKFLTSAPSPNPSLRLELSSQRFCADTCKYQKQKREYRGMSWECRGMSRGNCSLLIWRLGKGGLMDDARTVLHSSIVRGLVLVPLMESYAEPPPVVNRGEDTWTPFQEDFEYLRSKLGQTVRSPGHQVERRGRNSAPKS
ncbi:hypothetical protein J6590_057897 [Homalodisca vitripennis]|nr:hypothetical protein J6590_057897 [Homalodisca vitripennis]